MKDAEKKQEIKLELNKNRMFFSFIIFKLERKGRKNFDVVLLPTGINKSHLQFK